MYMYTRYKKRASIFSRNIFGPRSENRNPHAHATNDARQGASRCVREIRHAFFVFFLCLPYVFFLQIRAATGVCTHTHRHLVGCHTEMLTQTRGASLARGVFDKSNHVLDIFFKIDTHLTWRAYLCGTAQYAARFKTAYIDQNPP